VIAGKKRLTSKRNRPTAGGKPKAPGNIQSNKRRLRLEMFDWDSFEATELLGEGLSGTVFDGTLRGERVAIKLTDLWQYPELHKMMLGEARVYVKLRKLQGHGIPKLKGVGYTAGGLFALMTEFVGQPIEVGKLDDQMRETIVGVLASIHREGILHGDIKDDNILVEYCHDGPRITFIDFGSSKRFSSRKDSTYEMKALKKMIRFPEKIRRLE
jgi:serine/threonine protein kinase